MPDTYIQTEIGGYPFGFVLPSSGTSVLNDAIALVADGPNQEAAKLFYEFVTSDSALVDQANRFYRIPLRNDLDPGALLDWITSADIRAMNVDWERLTGRGPEWMQHWDEYIKGRGAEYLAERGLR